VIVLDRNQNPDSRIFFARGGNIGFTLVELLVVVVIIGILAALLFPLMKSAQARALGTKCAAQLREIQQANNLYANDHDGLCVLARSAGSVLKWYQVEDFLSYFGPIEMTSGATTPGLPLKFVCPLNGVSANRKFGGYGYNYTGDTTASGKVRQWARVKIQRPSQTIAFIDALDWQVQAGGSGNYGASDAGTASPNSAAAYRHAKGANAVFWDGHVEFLPRESLDVTMNPDNATRWKMLE